MAINKDPLDDGLEDPAQPEAVATKAPAKAVKAKPAGPTVAEMQAQLEALRATIEAKDAELARNKAASDNAMMALSSMQPIPTGKQNADGEDLFRYKIDLAPNGGLGITINGIDYYHGQEYDFSTKQLQSVMDIVQRTWMHEQSIKGKNDNFYRQGQNRTISGARH